MEPLNRTATELVDEAIDFADELRVDIHHLDNDAVVLDFGVDAPGGVEAGLLLAELQTGGLATVATRLDSLDGAPHTHVELATDHPRLALLASQRSGWRLPDGAGWASGPGQRLADTAEPVDGAPEETFDFAVLAIESRRLPDADLAHYVASELGVPSAGTFLATAAAASPAGATALAASVSEVALHRLEHVGYDPGHVRTVSGSGPLPPVGHDELTAKARANDAIAYGGRAHLVVDEPVDRAADLVFDATPYAGASYETLLADCGGDLGALEDAFAPAAVTVDVIGGGIERVGTVDEGRLAETWSR